MAYDIKTHGELLDSLHKVNRYLPALVYAVEMSIGTGAGGEYYGECTQEHEAWITDILIEAIKKVAEA